MNLNEKHRKIINDGATDVPRASMDKYEKLVFDILRGARELDEDDIRRAVWEGQMRYADPK